jgi:hypothetical protein
MKYLSITAMLLNIANCEGFIRRIMEIESKNNYFIDGDNAYIKIIQKNMTEHLVILDVDNLYRALSLGYKWHVQWHKAANKFYVHATIYLGMFNGKPRYKNITLHSFLFSKNKNEVIDHINGNGLDNRVSNITVGSSKHNSENRLDKNSNNTSGYRNVTKIGKYWRVQIQLDSQNHMFKEKFINVEDAGRFAEEMRLKYYIA